MLHAAHVGEPDGGDLDVVDVVGARAGVEKSNRDEVAHDRLLLGRNHHRRRVREWGRGWGDEAFVRVGASGLARQSRGPRGKRECRRVVGGIPKRRLAFGERVGGTFGLNEHRRVVDAQGDAVGRRSHRRRERVEDGGVYRHPTTAYAAIRDSAAQNNVTGRSQSPTSPRRCGLEASPSICYRSRALSRHRDLPGTATLEPSGGVGASPFAVLRGSECFVMTPSIGRLSNRRMSPWRWWGLTRSWAITPAQPR